jgi:4-amino-4-deoxy-L-arabinose transferase-like glycosyltransferase
MNFLVGRRGWNMEWLRTSRRQVDWLLVTAVLLGFFLNLGGVPLFDRDEGAFSGATREMLERGDFVSTYLNGEPRYDKPILIYWCQAPFVFALGARELAFRLPSALFAALWVWLVYRFARPRLGVASARASTFLMATALGVMMIGRAATADALLNLLITWALLDVYRYHESPRPGLVRRVYLAMGLGMLTKGPIAVLIVGAVSLLFFGSLGRWRGWLRAALAPTGWLLFLLVTLPWYVAQYLREGRPWVEGFFLEHNVDRFLGPLEGHGGALWYYLPIFLLAVLPHTALLLRVLPRARWWRRDDLDRFAWLWAGFVLVFFTLSGTKLPHYVYLGIVPLFLLMGRYREDLSSRVLALLPAALLLGVLGTLPWLVEMVRARLEDAQLAAVLSAAPGVLDTRYVLACMTGLAAVVLAGWRIGRPAWRALLPAGLLTALCLVLVVAPAIGGILQGPVKEAALLSRERDLPTVMWNLDNPSITVYRRAVTPDRPPRPGEAAIVRAVDLDRLGPHEVLFRRGGVALVQLSVPEPVSPPAEPSAAGRSAPGRAPANPPSRTR